MGVRDETIVYFDGVLKILGVCHGILGGLLIVMGVVVRLAVDHWTSVMLLALWIGVIVSPIHTSFSQNDLYQSVTACILARVHFMEKNKKGERLAQLICRFC